MPNPPSYPSITEASLTPFRAIEIQLKATPDLLDRSECPYPPFVKAMLRRLIGGEVVNTGTDLLLDPTEAELDSEIAKLYRTVRDDAASYTGSDMKDKMSFLKVANELLTKIVDLQTKRINIRNMARAQRVMIETMEEFLDPAQRSEFIKRMEAANV